MSNTTPLTSTDVLRAAFILPTLIPVPPMPPPARSLLPSVRLIGPHAVNAKSKNHGARILVTELLYIEHILLDPKIPFQIPPSPFEKGGLRGIIFMPYVSPLLMTLDPNLLQNNIS